MKLVASSAIIWLCLFGETRAQEVLPLLTKTEVFSFQVIEQEGRLAIAWGGGGNFPGLKNTFLRIEKIDLEEADLVFYYQANPSKDLTWPDFFIELVTSDGQAFLPPSERWVDLPPGPEGQKRRALTDATEDVLLLGQAYQIKVVSRLFGNFDCTQRPAFSFNKQWPYWAAAVLGAGAVVGGALLDRQKNSDYDTYRQLWREGRPASEALVYFDDSSQKAKQARLFYAIGASVLALDAALYFSKRRSIRRNQKLYDQYCAPQPTEGLSSTDPIRLRISGTPPLYGAASGLKLIVSF